MSTLTRARELINGESNPNVCFMADPAEPGAATGAAGADPAPKPAAQAAGGAQGAGEGAGDGKGGGAEPQDPAANQRGVMTFTKDKFNQRLSRSREAGRKAALTELEERVKKAGFKTLDEALEKLNGRAGAVEPAKPARTDDKPPDDKNDRPQNERAQKKADAELASANQKLQDELRIARRRADRLEQRMQAEATERELEKLAVAAGVKEVDVAVHLFQKMLQSLSDDEIEKLDEGKWFAEDLRKTKPYLFGVIDKPANTGTGVRPPSDGKSTPSPAEGVNGVIDGKTASMDQIRGLLGKYKGIKLPT